MADDKELRPTSVRLDFETGKKFREMVRDFPNQNEALKSLIATYELQNRKAAVADKQALITQFEEYANCITSMFVRSLEDNQNLRAIVQEEFSASLQSKDKIIQDLQGQLEATKQKADEAVQLTEVLTSEKAGLEEKLQNGVSEIETLRVSLSDKDELNRTLLDQCNGLRRQIEDMEKDAEQSMILRQELGRLKKEQDESVRERADLKKIVSELKQHEADALERLKEQLQIAQDKAVLKVEKSYQEQIQQLKAENQAEIDAYQQRYLDLLEQMKGQMAAVE